MEATIQEHAALVTDPMVIDNSQTHASPNGVAHVIKDEEEDLIAMHDSGTLFPRGNENFGGQGLPKFLKLKVPKFAIIDDGWQLVSKVINIVGEIKDPHALNTLPKV